MSNPFGIKTTKLKKFEVVRSFSVRYSQIHEVYAKSKADAIRKVKDADSSVCQWDAEPCSSTYGNYEAKDQSK